MTTTSRVPTQAEGKSRNNAHFRKQSLKHTTQFISISVYNMNSKHPHFGHEMVHTNWYHQF